MAQKDNTVVHKNKRRKRKDNLIPPPKKRKLNYVEYKENLVKRAMLDKDFTFMLGYLESSHCSLSIKKIAIEACCSDFVELFVELCSRKMIDPFEHKYVFLGLSCFYKSVNIIKYLIRERKVNFHGESGYFPVNSICAGGSVSVAALFLEDQRNIIELFIEYALSKEKIYRAPITISIRKNNWDFVKYISLKCGDKLFELTSRHVPIWLMIAKEMLLAKKYEMLYDFMSLDIFKIPKKDISARIMLAIVSNNISYIGKISEYDFDNAFSLLIKARDGNNNTIIH